LDPVLAIYKPERLVAALRAVEIIVGARWLEVFESSFEVVMNHTANQILTELERRSQDELGIDRDDAEEETR
jgi:hypothetical protein